MKLVRFNFRGDKWICYYLKDEDALPITEDEDTLAEIQFDKREIYFTISELNKRIVLHELFHMACMYQYVTSCNLTHDQSEELFCDIFAYEGENLLHLANLIYDQFIKFKDLPDDEEIDIQL